MIIVQSRGTDNRERIGWLQTFPFSMAPEYFIHFGCANLKKKKRFISPLRNC